MRMGDWEKMIARDARMWLARVSFPLDRDFGTSDEGHIRERQGNVRALRTWGTWPAARSADEDRQLVGDKLAKSAGERRADR